MRLLAVCVWGLVIGAMLAGSVLAGAVFADEAFIDPSNAGPDFKVQGEYTGQLKLDGPAAPTGVQVIAEGDGNFEAVIYTGGLPGAGWRRGDKRERVKGKTEAGVTNFKMNKWNAKIADGKMTFTSSDGEKLGTLERIERKSPTLGAKPPAGAIVLFDGTNVNQWAQMTDDGLLNIGTTTKEKFRDFQLHIEFRTPFMPKDRLQFRGNSGVYLQLRYELQILDSFGMEGEHNECGGIYTLRAPSINMCLPPLAWQTYDIDFTAARFDDKKQKTKNARLTVRHNGVMILDDVDLPTISPGGVAEYPGEGPIRLQEHTDPVVYRNIWAVKK